MKKFLCKLLLVAVGAVLLLFGLNQIYLLDHANRYHELDKFHDIETYDSKILISNIGSSHGEYDLNYDDLRGRGYTCFNFGLASQNYELDYAILQQYQDDLQEGGVMFIPVSYFSFNDEVVTDKEREERAVRYYQFLDPQYIPDYDWYVDLTTHRLPVLTAQDKLLKLLPDLWTQSGLSEKLSLRALAAESQEEQTEAVQEADGQSADAPQTESLQEEETQQDRQADPETVQRFEEIGYERYRRHFADKTEYFQQDQIDLLKKIIEFCREKNITPILITPPYTRQYTQYISAEWMQEFYEVLVQICQEEQTVYYDYGMDARFMDSLWYFGDPDHLNTEGAQYFTQILEQEIPAFSQVLQQNS